MTCARALGVCVLVGVGLPFVAEAAGDRPVLHEPIPPDPAEDLAMHVILDGNLPAAVDTPHGVVAAPDPEALPKSADRDYVASSDPPQFRPDRDTRRPDVSGYDEPFTPSMAPYKRLDAFDGVRADYTLFVREPRQAPVAVGGAPSVDDALFFEDLVVDIAPLRAVRIPSPGPGARVLRARLGVGGDDEDLRLARDGADNWLLSAPGAKRAHRARFVAELAISNAAFGGPWPDPAWSDLPRVTRLPGNVERDAGLVLSALGVSRRMRPREALSALVRYFRGFTDSADSPRSQGNVYLDLALSKKGVCRHRAFAFLVTAQALGLPTRMAVNEAHAWVEVHDGSLWRRIDLGGAGDLTETALDPSLRGKPVHEPPADSFAWPPGATRGDDVMARARSASGPRKSSAGPGGALLAEPQGAEPPGAKPFAPGAARAAATAVPPAFVGPAGGSPAFGEFAPPTAPSPEDPRPESKVALEISGVAAHRGAPLPVRGSVRAGDDPCPYLAVEVFLREVATQRTLYLGTLATGDRGEFSGEPVVPPSLAVGEYDVFARTVGDARCGAGASGGWGANR